MPESIFKKNYAVDLVSPTVVISYVFLGHTKREIIAILHERDMVGESIEAVCISEATGYDHREDVLFTGSRPIPNDNQE